MNKKQAKERIEYLRKTVEYHAKNTMMMTNQKYQTLNMIC